MLDCVTQAKTPTYRHHCLSHVLSTANEGTAQGTTEVWGGPLSGGDYVMAVCDRADKLFAPPFPPPSPPYNIYGPSIGINGARCQINT